MNLRDYRTVFAVVSLVLILIAAAPTLGLFVSFKPETERFSELWILGPGHMAEDYPFNVRADESHSVFVGVGNHMGSSSYYVIYLKFRNQTQPLPNATGSIPSSLTPLFEYRFFVVDDGIWEALLDFSVSNISRAGDSLRVGNLSINGAAFPVSSSAIWDSEFKGFRYQLFFELWRYDVTAESLLFHDRFVGIWLNITG
jgi:hypothetical protein